MKVVIYGFDTNIANHSMKEICFFFLIFAVMLVITGRFIERHSTNYQYIQLIRFGKISKWWRLLWLKVVLLSAIEVGVLFVGIGCINAVANWNIFRHGIVLPIILWVISISVVGTLQLILGLFPRGFMVSFLLIIGIEAFSMYSYPLLGNAADILPGSYMMLNRTTVLNGMMPIELMIIIEIAFVLIAGLFGHRLYRRSNC